MALTSQEHSLTWKQIALEYFKATKPRVVILIVLSGFVAFFISSWGSVTVPDVLVAAFSGYLAVGGSHAINAYIDRGYDQIMSRTRHRPLASDRINPPETMVLVGTAMIILGSGLASIYFNLIAGGLVLAGGLYYIFIYSIILKYRTSWNTFLGGIAGVLPILAGSAAASAGGSITLNAWLLAGVLFLWQPSHFWALAIYLKEDYGRAKIPMLPVVVGSRWTSLAIMASVVVLFFFGWLFPLLGQTSVIFGILLSVVGLWLVKSSYDLWKVSDLLEDDTPINNREEARKVAMKNFKVHNIYMAVISLFLMVDVVLFYPSGFLFIT